MAKRPVLQFKITLKYTKPPIWRRIQISDSCSFWDLHVAIQDAMGWTDSHLHHFMVNHPVENDKVFLGSPLEDDGFGSIETLVEWEHKVRDYLITNKKFEYEYDFGDSWLHVIEYEGEYPKEENQKYPICLGGKRACPPEDVGGIPGYEEFIEAISTPGHPEHQSLLDWVGGKYDPDEFDSKKVRFDSPSKHWKLAFE